VKNRVLVIILAGEIGNNLQPLTRVRSKPSIPFGGGFRIIDFVLSNCINSGIRQMFVLTQYRSWSLQRHIQDGWGISSSNLGEYVYCVPAQQKTGMEWYLGTADAIRQNLDLINLDLVQGKNIEHVLILPGDHIYKMDYRKFIKHHLDVNADITISGARISVGESIENLGMITCSADNMLVNFEENPKNIEPFIDASGNILASMGIYLFKVKTLVDALHGDGNDFVSDIIPALKKNDAVISVYDFSKQNVIKDYIIETRDSIRRKILSEKTPDSSYWRSIDSLDAYYDANIDLTAVNPNLSLYGDLWPIRSHQRLRPPSKFVMGGSMSESLISDGCIISGSFVHHSVLSPGVIVEKDAYVEDSVIFDDVVIGAGARIKRAIIDKEANIQPGVHLGFNAADDERRGCIISKNSITVVPREMVIS